MLGYIRKFIDEKRETEARIAFRNKMEIIDRMEAYYIQSALSCHSGFLERQEKRTP